MSTVASISMLVEPGNPRRNRALIRTACDTLRKHIKFHGLEITSAQRLKRPSEVRIAIGHLSTFDELIVTCGVRELQRQ